MPVLKELRPNRDLLDPNFSGYKLSLESVAVYQLPFECGVDHVLPSDEQYSFLHVKAFGLHNHLYADPWEGNSMYFIDKHRHVQNVRLSSTSRLEGPARVWAVPPGRVREAGHYNTCLGFPSPQLAVLTDGAGRLLLAATDRRPGGAPWKLLFSGYVCEKEQPFTLLHSRHRTTHDTQEVHCLLLHIDESVGRESGDGKESVPVFVNVLEWVVVVEEGDNVWHVKSRRQLSAYGSLEYAAIEDSCCSIYVACSKDIKFTADSEKPIEVALQGETKVSVSEKVRPDYMWMQTAEDVTAWFQLPEGTARGEVGVSAQSGHLAVTWRGHPLLSGAPGHGLDADLTTWTLEGGKLEVTLVKAERGLMWRELVEGDAKGEEVVDPALVADIHERLAHLTSDKLVTDPAGGCPTGLNSQQLEECDAFPTDSMVLARMDPGTHTNSHQINLGGHQWLFSAQLRPGSAPAMCVRHDVDGCVWQPEAPRPGDADWPCTHVGTFLAFGYVLASKQQRKFTVCAPDLSYVAVCEATRRVYLYRQPGAVAGELRNRATGRRVARVAKQQLASLDTDAEVLGAHGSGTALFLLLPEALVALRVDQA
ncbi:nudC domain-containing protein 1 [Bacillus rossius redtenbacheri]|uniref:nudC domain-containing protein 1 n=1 Tax=Bacillus rossius redtenbacheri TaxID=93214 RepID=UPI002FDDBE3B